MAIKAYGYVRVSGKGQVEGDGFTRQEKEILAYAKANKIEIAGIFREQGISGTTDENERPAFQEMLTAILANGVKTIIVEGLDRLAREYRIQESLLIYLASKGITLINARTGENVTEAVMADPMRKALIQIQGVFAELEKSMLVKKLRMARERKREKEGKCEGRKSLSEIAPDTVVLIRQLRRKLPGSNRMTDAKVAEELNARGLVTASGKTWNRFHVQNTRKALSIP